MGDPVEPIALDAILLEQVLWNRIDSRSLRHRAVKPGVEDRHHGHIVPQRRPRSVDPGQASRIVQRRQLIQPLDLGHHSLVDADRLAEPLSSMHDPVPHGLHTNLSQALEQPLHSRAMIRNLSFLRRLGDPVLFDQECGAPADAVDHASNSGARGRGPCPAVIPSDLAERELQRGAPTVQDQHLHHASSIAPPSRGAPTARTRRCRPVRPGEAASILRPQWTV